MTINNIHKRIGTTGGLGLMPALANKITQAKDFEGVIKSDGNFLKEFTYKQLDTMSLVVFNYKEVVKLMLAEPGFKT
jgi:hypothetical protein